jgi:hypothetical protein
MSRQMRVIAAGTSGLRGFSTAVVQNKAVVQSNLGDTIPAFSNQVKDEVVAAFLAGKSKVMQFVKDQREEYDFVAPTPPYQHVWGVSWPGKPDIRTAADGKNDLLKSLDTWENFTLGSIATYKKLIKDALPRKPDLSQLVAEREEARLHKLVFGKLEFEIKVGAKKSLSE